MGWLGSWPAALGMRDLRSDHNTRPLIRTGPLSYPPPTSLGKLQRHPLVRIPARQLKLEGQPGQDLRAQGGEEREDGGGRGIVGLHHLAKVGRQAGRRGVIRV